MYGIPKEKYNFTPEQEELIEFNHDFFIGFLKKYCRLKKYMNIGWGDIGRQNSWEDIYDVAIFGYLKAIKEFDLQSSLFPLRTLIVLRVKEALYSYFQKYMKTDKQKTLTEALCSAPLGDERSDNEDDLIGYILNQIPDASQTNENLEDKIMLSDILTTDLTTDLEKVYCRYLIMGYSVPEIANLINASNCKVKSDLFRMRKRLKFAYYGYIPKRPLLKEHVYCPFCGNEGRNILVGHSTEPSQHFTCTLCNKSFHIPKSSLNRRTSVTRSIEDYKKKHRPFAD